MTLEMSHLKVKSPNQKWQAYHKGIRIILDSNTKETSQETVWHMLHCPKSLRLTCRKNIPFLAGHEPWKFGRTSENVRLLHNNRYNKYIEVNFLVLVL